MAQIRKPAPELLLVSFCDILTISISGLFMATIITVYEATKIPELSMVPRAIATDKVPVFFECRRNELFPVGKDELDQKVAELLSSLRPNVRGGDLSQFLKAIEGQKVGNEYYDVEPRYLLLGQMAVEPKTNAPPGESIATLDRSDSKFWKWLSAVNTGSQYVAFLVRDDSFDIFKKARELADRAGWDTGWELLGEGEPIKFGGKDVGVTIDPQ